MLGGDVGEDFVPFGPWQQRAQQSGGKPGQDMPVRLVRQMQPQWDKG